MRFYSQADSWMQNHGRWSMEMLHVNNFQSSFKKQLQLSFEETALSLSINRLHYKDSLLSWDSQILGTQQTSDHATSFQLLKLKKIQKIGLLMNTNFRDIISGEEVFKERKNL
jgi:hypothetical protein